MLDWLGANPRPSGVARSYYVGLRGSGLASSGLGAVGAEIYDIAYA